MFFFVFIINFCVYNMLVYELIEENGDMEFLN